MNVKYFLISTKDADKLSRIAENIINLVKESRHAYVLFRYLKDKKGYYNYTTAVFRLELLHQRPQWDAVQHAIQDATGERIVLRDGTPSEIKLFDIRRDK